MLNNINLKKFKLEDKSCLFCGRKIKNRRYHAIYCSKKCKNKYAMKKYRERKSIQRIKDTISKAHIIFNNETGLIINNEIDQAIRKILSI